MHKLNVNFWYVSPLPEDEKGALFLILFFMVTEIQLCFQQV